VPADQKALFLARDEIINTDLGQVYRIEDFQLLPDVLTSCRRFHEAGYKVTGKYPASGRIFRTSRV
jgi:histidinol phosphatase-like enzyme